MHSRKYYFDVWVLPVLAATVFIPTILFVSFHATSYALGTAVASLFALTVRSLVVLTPTRHFSLSDLHVDRVLLAAIGALAFQSMVAYATAGQFLLVRFAESIGLLLTMFIGACSVSALIDGASEKLVRRMLYMLTGILAFMAVVGALGWTPVMDTRFNRPIFIFAEPSHFALVLAPFLLWVVVTCRGIAGRAAAFAVAFVLLLLLKNLTFLFLVGLASLIALRARALFLVACCLLLVILSDLGYFLPRMQLTTTTSNLSVLVWLQGWEEALIGLRETVGVGLGFQQLGVNGPKGAFAHVISEQLRLADGIENGFLNLLDGGTLGAKLVGELGLLGIVLVVTCLYLIYGSIRNLREIASGVPSSSATVFFYCCLVSLSMDLFIRSTGYFSPSVLLFLTGVFGLWRMGRLSFIMNQGIAAQ